MFARDETAEGLDINDAGDATDAIYSLFDAASKRYVQELF